MEKKGERGSEEDSKSEMGPILRVIHCEDVMDHIRILAVSSRLVFRLE